MTEIAAKPVTPFVGREAELHQLQQALGSVIATKRPRFTLIQGDFGVGKTALVEHFLAEASDPKNPSILIGRGRCAMETEGSGLLPFSQLLVNLTEKSIQWGVVLGNLWDFVKEVAPAWLETAGVAGALVKSTVKTVEEGSKLLGRSAYSQENVFMQFTNALAKLAEKQPVVAFVDDLHWADASSLRLLFHLTRYLQDRAVLFVCTYRPVEAMVTGTNTDLFREIRANLSASLNTTEIVLQQGIDVAAYIDRRYPFHTFPSELTRRVQQQTGGHPLFVNQLLLWWEETGIIVSKPISEDQTRWVLTQEAYIPAIPPSLGAMLDERLRQMTGELRQMLTDASVEGEDFTAQTIINLMQLDRLKAYQALKALRDNYQMIVARGTQEVGSNIFDLYRFAHSFFREHIYKKLEDGERRILHQMVAETLESLFADRRPVAGQLALHFHEAHALLKATQYALMSAQFEQSRYIWAEGESWCKFGLGLLDKLPSNAETTRLRQDLLEQSGQGHYNAGKHDQAYERYWAAINLAVQIGAGTERIASLCARLADICDERDQYDEGTSFIEQGKAILNEQAVPLGEAHLYLAAMEGLLQCRHGQIELAIQTLRQALADATKLPQTPTLERIEVDIYSSLGIALGYPNRYSESTLAYQKAIEIADRIGENTLLTVNRINLACDYIWMGKLDEAEVEISKSVDSARQNGDQDDEAYALGSQGYIFLLRDKPDQAISALEQAISLSELMGAAYYLPSVYADLALANLALSNLETAYQHAQKSVNLASGPYKSAYTLDALAQVEAARQDWKSAIQHFKQAISFYQQTGDRHLAARAQRHFADALLRKGDRPQAVELLQTALATFQQLNLAHEVVETQRLLDVD